MHLCVLYVSQKTQPILHRTTLTDCFCNSDGECLLRGTNLVFKQNVLLSSKTVKWVADLNYVLHIQFVSFIKRPFTSFNFTGWCLPCDVLQFCKWILTFRRTCFSLDGHDPCSKTLSTWRHNLAELVYSRYQITSGNGPRYVAQYCLPPSFQAPSTWYAAVAAPNRKCGGKE